MKFVQATFEEAVFPPVIGKAALLQSHIWKRLAIDNFDDFQAALSGMLESLKSVKLEIGEAGKKQVQEYWKYFLLLSELLVVFGRGAEGGYAMNLSASTHQKVSLYEQQCVWNFFKHAKCLSICHLSFVSLSLSTIHHVSPHLLVYSLCIFYDYLINSVSV